MSDSFNYGRRMNICQCSTPCKCIFGDYRNRFPVIIFGNIGGIHILIGNPGQSIRIAIFRIHQSGCTKPTCIHGNIIADFPDGNAFPVFIGQSVPVSTDFQEPTVKGISLSCRNRKRKVLIVSYGSFPLFATVFRVQNDLVGIGFPSRVECNGSICAHRVFCAIKVCNSTIGGCCPPDKGISRFLICILRQIFLTVSCHCLR